MTTISASRTPVSAQSTYTRIGRLESEQDLPASTSNEGDSPSDVEMNAVDADTALPNLPPIETDVQLKALRVRRSASAESPVAPTPVFDIVTQTEPDEAAYIRVLRQSLRDWVDYDKARQYSGNACQVLRAVFHHKRQPLPESFETTFDVSQIEDESWFDEASLLYHQLHGTGTNEEAGPAEGTTLDTLRARFLETLRADCEGRHTLDRLLAASTDTGGAQGAPFFDGLALRNAFGQSFDDLVRSPRVFADQAFAAFTVDKKRQLLTEKFDEIGESRQYTIGTVQHSLASIVIRIAKYRGDPVPVRFENEEALAKAFRRCEREWDNDRAFYPIHPMMLFATHLVRASGVELIASRELDRRYGEIVDMVGESYRRGNRRPLLWMSDFLAKWNADGVPWDRRGQAVRQQAVLSLFDALGEATVTSGPISPLAERAKQAGLLGEILVGDDWRGKAIVLLIYAYERLMASFGRPPAFDRRSAAIDILRRHGASDETIAARRSYFIPVGSGVIEEAREGDLIQEFFDRLGGDGRIPSSMSVGGATAVRPLHELQAAEEAFNGALASDPWVRAKARENLRMQSRLLTDEAVDREARRIADQYQTETESHRGWMKLLEDGVNMVPVVGSAYNLVEGIRNHDAEQAIMGGISLGMDIISLAVGGAGESRGAAAGGGRALGARSADSKGLVRWKPASKAISTSEVPVRKRPALVEFEHVAKQLGIPSAAIENFPNAIARGTAFSAEFELRDGNVPPAYRSLATQVRNGESGVKWQGYDVVRLANEDRIVPVEHAGGTYHEIDWYSTHRARHASLIARDAESGAFYSEAGLKGGGGGAEILRRVDSRGVNVEQRPTVTGVTGILRVAADTTMRAFDEIFDRSISVTYDVEAEGAARLDVKAFLGRLYQRSGTFRRLLNHYDATVPGDEKLWRLFYGKRGPTGAISATHPWSRTIYIAPETELGQERYMSAAGTTPYESRAAVLHEVLHALTKLEDPEQPNLRLTPRAEPRFDRGPVVYLTDKMLSEAGFDFEERVTYVDMAGGAEDARLSTAVQETHHENEVLDPIVDRQRRLSITADTLVEEVRIADRLTVKEWGQIAPMLKKKGKWPSVLTYGSDSWGRLKSSFALLANGESGVVLSEQMKALIRVSSRFQRKSPTFRALLESLPQSQPVSAQRQWTFVFDKTAATAALAPGEVVSSVDTVNRKIYLFEDGAKYLSKQGLRSMEFERRVAHQLVAAITGLPKVAGSDAYRNRGAEVRLVDRILAESGYHFPEQLAAALALPDDPASQRKLQARLTAARRSSSDEDVFLDGI